MSNERADTNSESLRRIADALECLIEMQKKRRKKRSSAPLEYDQYFLDAWKIYPKRNGSNSKAGGFKSWRARAAQANDSLAEIHLMFEGTARYAAWCDATEKTGSETVMQASRFYGPRQEYLNAWEIVVVDEVIKVPYDHAKLKEFAARYGLEAGVGESWGDFKKRVERHLAQSTL